MAKLIEPTGQKPDREGGLSSELATAILQQHSTPGMILGTAGYMSPEQAQGKVNEIILQSGVDSPGRSTSGATTVEVTRSIAYGTPTF